MTGMEAIRPAESPELAEVEILRLAAGGDGVGRWTDGRAVFVPRTAPGDLVEVEARRVYRRHVAGRVRRLISPGPGRVSPRCAHYDGDDCGGCQFQHLALDVQLEAKSSMVGDALRRIGKVACSDPEVHSDGRAWGYRNKITLSRNDAGSGFGFHCYHDPNRVFDLDRCEIAAPGLNELWDALAPRVNDLGPEVERLVLRLDPDGGQHILVRTGSNRAGDSAQVAAALEALGPATVWHEPRGGPARRLAGPVADRGAVGFEQVNREMAARVRHDALEDLAPVDGCHVWDLYAGSGEASRDLAAAGATVEAVERDPHAGELGRHRASGLPVRWHEGDVEAVLPRLAPSDRVMVNPPRTGLSRRACRLLLDRRPRRMVYVSCDPATLARDLGILLAGGADYQVTRVRAYDLFPQTAHVETVVRVERP